MGKATVGAHSLSAWHWDVAIGAATESGHVTAPVSPVGDEERHDAAHHKAHKDQCRRLHTASLAGRWRVRCNMGSARDGDEVSLHALAAPIHWLTINHA